MNTTKHCVEGCYANGTLCLCKGEGWRGGAILWCKTH